MLISVQDDCKVQDKFKMSVQDETVVNNGKFIKFKMVWCA